MLVRKETEMLRRKFLMIRVALLRVIEVLMFLIRKVQKEIQVAEWKPLLINKETFFLGGKVLKDQIRNLTEKSFSQ